MPGRGSSKLIPYTEVDMARKTVCRALLSLFLLAGLSIVALGDEGRQPIWQPVSLGAGDGGTYFLTRDVFSSSGPAIVFAGTGIEDVVIDLNGFRVQGPSSTSAMTITNLRSFSIRNGAVSCATGGFGAMSVTDVQDVTVEDMEFAGCNSGMTISNATSFAVRRNVVLDSVAGRGIWISNFGAPFPGRGVIEENTVRVDASFGIRIENSAESEAVAILNNRVEAGSGAGLVARGNGFLISGNIVSRSQGDGIWVVAGVKGCRVTNNVVSLNGGNGILLSDASSCQVSDNVVHDNGGDGIYLENSSKITIDRNLLTDNGFAGIKMRTSTSDIIYRDNVARGNSFASGACAGNPPACASPDICDDGGVGNVSGGNNFLPGPC